MHHPRPPLSPNRCPTTPLLAAARLDPVKLRACTPIPTSLPDRYILRVNCDGTLTTLWRSFPKLLHDMEVELIRRYARKSWVWMAAYDCGINTDCGAADTFVRRIAKKHRDVPTATQQEELEEYMETGKRLEDWL